MHMCECVYVCAKIFLRILPSDPCENPPYANPSKVLTLCLLYFIFIDAPFPPTIRSGPVTLRSVT